VGWDRAFQPFLQRASHALEGWSCWYEKFMIRTARLVATMSHSEALGCTSSAYYWLHHESAMAVQDHKHERTGDSARMAAHTPASHWLGPDFLWNIPGRHRGSCWWSCMVRMDSNHRAPSNSLTSYDGGSFAGLHPSKAPVSPPARSSPGVYLAKLLPIKTSGRDDATAVV